MGKFTIERWRCDRCGTEWGKRPEVEQQIEINAAENWPAAAGRRIHWRELCADCTRIAAKVFDLEPSWKRDP